jgi:hypothetical protein
MVIIHLSIVLEGPNLYDIEPKCKSCCCLKVLTGSVVCCKGLTRTIIARYAPVVRQIRSVL